MPFSEYKHQPHSSVIEGLVKNNFPLASNPVFRLDPVGLAQGEFQSVDDMLSRKMPGLYNQDSISGEQLMRKFQQLSVMIKVREKDIREQLENLAVEIVTELFNPPEHLDLKAMITSRLDMDIEPEEQDDREIKPIDPERLPYLNEEIQKRVLLNGLVHGSAMHIYKSAHYLVSDKLDEISPSLMPLYDEYVSLVNFSLWRMDINAAMREVSLGNQITQGQCSLDFHSHDSPSLEAKAMNFPVLLHELTKGIIDYLICHAIPEDLSEDELDYYYNKADDYANELWHYILAPGLWTTVVTATDADTQELPGFIYNMTQMSLEQLTEEFKNYI